MARKGRVQELEALRRRIDEIDDRLLELLNERARLAQEIAEIKRAGEEAAERKRQGDGGEERDHFYRPEREAQILRRIKAKNQGPLDGETVARIFREIMSACLALEQPLEVAFLGPEGTFTQEAALKHFGHAVLTSPLPTIEEIFRAVASGSCHFGVVPVENSSEGVVTHTLDSLLQTELKIAGEVELRIHHNLLSLAQRLEEIEVVYAHEQALAQCREWLDRFLPKAARLPVSSNAEAARRAAKEPRAAAIASEVAASLYGLEILERNIENDPENTTRFLVIGRHPVPPSGDDKTSIVISTGNFPGALYRALAPLAESGISMTKIESRPSRRGVWDYVFFIDFEGHREEPKVAEALERLKERVLFLKWLGSYPKAVL